MCFLSGRLKNMLPQTKYQSTWLKEERQHKMRRGSIQVKMHYTPEVQQFKINSIVYCPIGYFSVLNMLRKAKCHSIWMIENVTRNAYKKPQLQVLTSDTFTNQKCLMSDSSEGLEFWNFTLFEKKHARLFTCFIKIVN